MFLFFFSFFCARPLEKYELVATVICETVNVEGCVFKSQRSFVRVCVRVCACGSSSCLCYPFSATLPWRQCPPGVMGDECTRAIYSLLLPPSIHPSPSLFLRLTSSLPSPSCNLLLSVSPLSISFLPSFLCSFFPSLIGLTLSSSK